MSAARAENVGNCLPELLNCIREVFDAAQGIRLERKYVRAATLLRGLAPVPLINLRRGLLQDNKQVFQTACVDGLVQVSATRTHAEQLLHFDKDPCNSFVLSYTQLRREQQYKFHRLPSHVLNTLVAPELGGYGVTRLWFDKVGSSQNTQLQAEWSATANMMYGTYPVLAVPNRLGEVRHVLPLVSQDVDFGFYQQHISSCYSCSGCVSKPGTLPLPAGTSWQASKLLACLERGRFVSGDALDVACWLRGWPLLERTLGLENYGLYMLSDHWAMLLSAWLVVHHVLVALRHHLSLPVSATQVINGTSLMACPGFRSLISREKMEAVDTSWLHRMENILLLELAEVRIIDQRPLCLTIQRELVRLRQDRNECTLTPRNYPLDGDLVAVQWSTQALVMGPAGIAHVFDHRNKLEALAMIRGLLPVVTYRGVAHLSEADRERLLHVCWFGNTETFYLGSASDAFAVPYNLLIRWNVVNSHGALSPSGAVLVGLPSPIAYQGETNSDGASAGAVSAPVSEWNHGRLLLQYRRCLNASCASYPGLGQLPAELVEEFCNDAVGTVAALRARLLRSLRFVGVVNAFDFQTTEKTQLLVYAVDHDLDGEAVGRTPLSAEYYLCRVYCRPGQNPRGTRCLHPVARVSAALGLPVKVAGLPWVKQKRLLARSCDGTSFVIFLDSLRVLGAREHVAEASKFPLLGIPPV